MQLEKMMKELKISQNDNLEKASPIDCASGTLEAQHVYSVFSAPELGEQDYDIAGCNGELPSAKELEDLRANDGWGI